LKVADNLSEHTAQAHSTLPIEGSFHSLAPNESFWHISFISCTEDSQNSIFPSPQQEGRPRSHRNNDVKKLPQYLLLPVVGKLRIEEHVFNVQLGELAHCLTVFKYLAFVDAAEAVAEPNKIFHGCKIFAGHGAK
jgi:hypothetical protein